jgi:Domain of unknown function (DUF3291)
MARGWNIAEMNVAAMRYPVRDPRMAGFFAAIDAVNADADAAPGFVWRMPEYLEETDAIEVGGAANLLVNMSVWRDLDALRAFTYESHDHLQALRRRREWFERTDIPNYVLWWVPEGELPSVAEGRRRLALLHESGPGPDAFTFNAVQPEPLAVAS